MPNAIAGGDSVSFSVWLKGTSNTANKPQLVAWNYKDSSSNYLGGFQNTVNITNQWQRYTLLYTAPATTNLVSFMIYIPGVTNGENFDLSMDAVQLEKGAFPTSYIPTTSTVVTRNADTVIVPTAGWNAATGTWVVIASRSSGDVQGQELLFWGSGTNNLDLGVWNTALLASSTDSANGYNNPSYSYAVPTTLGVAAMSWTTVAMTPYWNGSAFANNAGRNPTITQTAASLGWAYVGADNRWNAPIQRATVYPTALTSGKSPQ